MFEFNDGHKEDLGKLAPASTSFDTFSLNSLTMPAEKNHDTIPETFGKITLITNMPVDRIDPGMGEVVAKPVPPVDLLPIDPGMGEVVAKPVPPVDLILIDPGMGVIGDQSGARQGWPGRMPLEGNTIEFSEHPTVDGICD